MGEMAAELMGAADLYSFSTSNDCKQGGMGGSCALTLAQLGERELAGDPKRHQNTITGVATSSTARWA